jgi:hypothetical protein
MKTVGKPCKCIQFLLIVALCGTSYSAQDDTAVFSSLNDSLAALVIGDFKGLIDGASAVVNQFMPGMGAAIVSQAGSFVGDSELTGFEDGDGIAAIAFPDNLVVVFAEVGESERSLYQENTTKSGFQSAAVGDLTVFSDRLAGIETGQKVATEVQKTLLEGNDRASLETYIHVPKIIETYKEEIDGAFKSIPEMMKASMAKSATAQPQSEGMANIIQAEFFSVYNLISQLDIFRLELTPTADGISLGLSFLPKKDTNLSRLLIHAKGGDAGNLVRMLPGDGAFRMEAAYDAKAFEDFALKEMDAAFASLDWTDEEKANMRKFVEESMQIHGSGFAGAMFGDSDAFLSGAFIYNVEDPERSLKLFREMNANIESFGILDLYKKMGMEMKFEYKENFKEHKGIPIHRMEMNLDLEGMEEPGAEAFLKSFSNLNYDLAIVEGFLVYTMGDTPIEELVDRVLEGGSADTLPLISKNQFGEGGSFYMDLGIEGYLRTISNVMKSVPDESEKKGTEEILSKIDASLAVLSGAPPICMALFADSEGADFKIHLPTGLLQKASQAVMGAMMPAMAPKGD